MVHLRRFLSFSACRLQTMAVVMLFLFGSKEKNKQKMNLRMEGSTKSTRQTPTGLMQTYVFALEVEALWTAGLMCVCVWLAGVSEPSTVEEGEQEEEEGERVVPQHMVGPDSLDPIWTSTAVQVRSGGVNTKIVLT